MATETFRIDWVREEETPWRFRKIHIHDKFIGRNLSETYIIKRVIELTEAKYCSTYATLRDVVEIIGNYEIVRVDEQ